MGHRQTDENTGETLQSAPDALIHYLAHTVGGRSIRSLARARNVHPSTIMRQVRRFESLRDDPLVDQALRTIIPLHDEKQHTHNSQEEKLLMTHHFAMSNVPKNDEFHQIRLDREALLVLRRLCETGAVLAVARDMESAVVVREDDKGASMRTAVVEREIAQAMALKMWISCANPEARIARYFITKAGREALRRLTAAEENRANGLRDTTHDRKDASHGWDLREDMGGGSRYMVTESPLIGLARRKDRSGAPFLTKEQVGVGERLRQDYELSQADDSVAEDWRGALATEGVDLPKATLEARARVVGVLEDLGPGLADVVLHCCCFLEGLEKTEKKMGWSSRSGKIVLRIALTRMIRHYEETQGKYGPMIG